MKYIKLSLFTLIVGMSLSAYIANGAQAKPYIPCEDDHGREVARVICINGSKPKLIVHEDARKKAAKERAEITKREAAQAAKKRAAAAVAKRKAEEAKRKAEAAKKKAAAAKPVTVQDVERLVEKRMAQEMTREKARKKEKAKEWDSSECAQRIVLGAGSGALMGGIPTVGTGAIPGAAIGALSGFTTYGVEKLMINASDMIEDISKVSKRRK